MALPHPDVNAVLRFPAKLGTSHKKAPQNLFKTPFAPSNFPPRRHTVAPHVFLRRAGRLCPPKHRTPCPSVGGDAHAVERSGTSTLWVHRPLCHGSAAASSLPCGKGGIVCTSPLRCHSEPVTNVTGVGIRIPAPAGAESPKPPLCKGRRRPQGDGGIVTSGRGRAPPLHTSADSLCAIRAGGCGHPPLRNHRRRMRHTHGRTESSAPTPAYRARTLSLSCHSEPVLTLAWESAPRARRRGTPSRRIVQRDIPRPGAGYFCPRRQKYPKTPFKPAV